jgi:hypothetical protein
MIGLVFGALPNSLAIVTVECGRVDPDEDRNGEKQNENMAHQSKLSSSNADDKLTNAINFKLCGRGFAGNGLRLDKSG